MISNYFKSWYDLIDEEGFNYESEIVIPIYSEAYNENESCLLGTNLIKFDLIKVG